MYCATKPWWLVNSSWWSLVAMNWGTRTISILAFGVSFTPQSTSDRMKTPLAGTSILHGVWQAARGCWQWNSWRCSSLESAVIVLWKAALVNNLKAHKWGIEFYPPFPTVAKHFEQTVNFAGHLASTLSLEIVIFLDITMRGPFTREIENIR